VEHSFRWTNKPDLQSAELKLNDTDQHTPQPEPHIEPQLVKKPAIVEQQESFSAVIARKIKETPALLDHFMNLIGGESTIITGRADQSVTTATVAAESMVPHVGMIMARKGIALHVESTHLGRTRKRRGSLGVTSTESGTSGGCHGGVNGGRRHRRGSSCHQLERLKPIFGVNGPIHQSDGINSSAKSARNRLALSEVGVIRKADSEIGLKSTKKEPIPIDDNALHRRRQRHVRQVLSS
jgi:hypothetical protein